MKKLLFLLPIFFSFYSCTGFKGFNQGNTSVNSLKQLKGTYKNTPIKTDSIKNYNAAQDRFFYHIINRKLLVKRFYPKKRKKYKFKIKAYSSNKLLISFFEDDKVIKQFKVRAKIKDDGFVYLKNKNLKILFFALFNGYSHKKTRLMIDQNQNLIAEVTSRGASLVVIALFATGHFKYRYVFEKID